MRYLYFLPFTVLVGCTSPYGGKCDDFDGLKVSTVGEVPGEYTGTVVICDGRDRVHSLLNYKYGKKDGIRRCWHEDGQLRLEENYNAGKLDGVGRRWWNGQLKTEIHYVDGKEHGVSRGWHENGQLQFEDYYNAGKLHGACRSWYENGQLMREDNYKDGELHGVYRWWHENGQLEHEAHYENFEIQDDKIVYYKEDGNILRTVFYQEGRVVRCEGNCSGDILAAQVGVDSPSANDPVEVAEDVVAFEEDSLKKDGFLIHEIIAVYSFSEIQYSEFGNDEYIIFKDEAGKDWNFAYCVNNFEDYNISASSTNPNWQGKKFKISYRLADYEQPDFVNIQPL